MNTWEEDTSYEVDEIGIELESEVLETILKKNSVLKYAEDNIPALMACLQPLPVQAGQTVITQGEVDSDYYIISKGKCRIEQKRNGQRKNVVAELSEGDSFGEEALITEAPRNASVIILEDSVLLRMNRDDFNQFLKPSLINYLDIHQCEEKLIHGAKWIDTRQPLSHEADGQGINIPLASARIHAGDLNKDTQYLLYCDNGKISTVVSMIFKQHGLTSFVLKGGLNEYKKTSPQLLPLKQATTLQSEHSEPSLDEASEPVNSDNHKKEINHYKDLLIELTINSQKEIRKLKMMHQKQIQQLQTLESQPQKPENSKKSSAPSDKHLNKKLRSLENALSQKEELIKKLTDEINSHDVQYISHQEVIKAYNDIKNEYEQKEREYQTTINELQNEQKNTERQLN